MVGIKKSDFEGVRFKLQLYRDIKIEMQVQVQMASLCAETVECAPGTLESVDDVEGSDCFPLCVLSVSYRVADDLAGVRRVAGKRRRGHTFSRKILRTPRVSS